MSKYLSPTRSALALLAMWAGIALAVTCEFVYSTVAWWREEE